MASQKLFLTLFLEHQADIRALVAALVAERARREDVFQEIAITLWQELGKFDRSRSFRAWARGVAANKILQERRKDRRFPLAFSPEVIERILNTFQARDSAAISLRERGLQHCRNKLPERSQQLLQRHYEKRESCIAIAKDTERSLEAVYQSLSRIRKQLAGCIENYVKQFENR